MARHSRILAWKFSWTEEPGRQQFMESHSQKWMKEWEHAHNLNQAIDAAAAKSLQSCQTLCKPMDCYCTIGLISHTSKVMLRILQARLQQYLIWEFQMFKLDLEKAEEPEIKLPTSTGSKKKQENSRKNIYFCFIDYAKGFNCVDHNKLENSLRDGNTRPPYLAHEKSVCRSRSNS